MGIYVAIEEGGVPKSRGDLLEKISKKLLEAHDYEVQDEVRKTGMELDLLCQNKTNPAKKMYVECKAYNDDNPIQADVITNLTGRLFIKKYKEAWLIATSSLGKEAKGLVDDIKAGEDSEKFTFYTPERLVSALQSANVICLEEIAIQKITELTKDNVNVGETHLLISSLGNFWITEYLHSGKPDGIIFCYARNGEIVTDEGMIDNLQKLDFKFRDYDLGMIFRLLDPNDKTMIGRKLRGAKLNESYTKEALEKLGTIPTAIRGRMATIDDIFVYPDLEEVNVNETKEISKIISSEVIASRDDHTARLILGDDLSGKTTLTLMLQRKIAERNEVAIRLDSNSLRNVKAVAFDKAVLKAFSNQYAVGGIPTKTIESYVDDIRKKITLIIDDIDKFNNKGKPIGDELVAHLISTYGKVVIFANSTKELEYTTSNEGQKAFGEFRIYRLLQLGHMKRDELIGRWIDINSEEPLDKSQLLIKTDDFASKINATIGANYLPTYSFYVLAILEMLERGGKAQFQGSEYAALYGHLVNHALLLNKVKATDFGFYNTYLSYLAYELYARKSLSITLDEAELLFGSYLEEMGLTKSYTVIHKKLTDAKILRVDGDCFFFNLPYYRYYFFAKYLSDTISTTSTKSIIRHLVGNLHEDDNANTIIFLVHHSKDPEIINVIIEKAKKQFELIKPQTLLNNDVESINALISEDIQLVLRNESATKHRKKVLKRKDAYARKVNNSKTDKQSNILDVYGNITSAFRTIDVLGKITSNYYGELNADRKNLIMKELYELGFRSLRTFLESFNEYIDALRAHIETKIDDKNITSQADKERAANQIIYSFTHIIAYSFIKRVSDSVMSPDLIVTIENVLGEDTTPAGQLTSVATKLNFPGGLEKNKDHIVDLYKELSNNSIARDLLRFLVLEHMYKFEIGYKERQSVCSHLNINFTTSERKRLQARTKKNTKQGR